MPQLVLNEHERIAHALGAEILVKSGSVGATEAVRREVVLNWQARRDLLEWSKCPSALGLNDRPYELRKSTRSGCPTICGRISCANQRSVGASLG